MSDITVAISAIPERADMLARAVASVAAQTEPPAAVIIRFDLEGLGAPTTRTRVLEMVQTPWVAFLDDDDEFLPTHLEHLRAHAEETGADMVFPWFYVRGGTDPVPANEHREFDVNNPHQTTVTVLVRTEAALTVNGFMGSPVEPDGEVPELDPEGHRAGEEFRFAIKLAQAGYKIAHLHERTWIWHHHAFRGANTMGLPARRREVYAH